MTTTPYFISDENYDWGELTQQVPGLKITSAGGLVPYQAEGTLQGYPFYYRERSGVASLDVAHKGEEPFNNKVLYHYHEETKDFQSHESFMSHMVKFIPKLQKPQFVWSFLGSEVKIRMGTSTEANSVEVGGFTLIPTGESRKYFIQAETAEQAYQFLTLPYTGEGSDYQNAYIDLANIQPTPLEADERVWPDPEPVFVVHPTLKDQ